MHVVHSKNKMFTSMHAPWAHKGTDSQVIATLNETKPLQFRGNFIMAKGLAIHLRFVHTGRKRRAKRYCFKCRHILKGCSHSAFVLRFTAYNLQVAINQLNPQSHNVNKPLCLDLMESLSLVAHSFGMLPMV